jgi:glycosyltransferase involved in cell wall biosynthesis
MSVCYVFQDEYPWDVRVEKIVTSLAAHQIPVQIVARNRKGRARVEQLHLLVDVHRLTGPLNRVLRNICNFPAFFSPFWLHRMRQVVRDHGVRLLIVRDLPLGPAALMVGRWTGVPVLMDMAENYPAMIQDTWTYRGPRLADYLLRNPRALRVMERAVLRRLDGVLVVSPQSGERVVSLGVRKDRVWVVGNTPRLPEASGDWIPRRDERADLQLLYVGGIEESRGLDVVIRGVAILRDRGIATHLTIAGQGTGEGLLRRLASSLGVEAQVTFLGWVDPRQVPTQIAKADVCLVPHYLTEHTATTVPNKIFDYMLQGKPVVVTDAPTLREIADSSKAGLAYRDKDPGHFAEAIASLTDRDRRAVMGEAGRRAVLAKYNWAADEAVLLQAVRTLIAAG